MQEELLSGGNMDPVVRVGDTVRRVSGEWTEAVHELLRRYEAAGIPETPRPRGIDGEGREVLTFIEGTTLEQAPPETRWAHSMLRESGALLRRLHDASEPLAAPGRSWRSETHSPIEVVCHNDFAPYNLIVREGRLVGVIDFDMASPGSRLWDFAYLAYRLVPYAEDAVGFDPARYGSREDRLRELIEAYGAGFGPSEVRTAAARRLDDLAAFTDRRAADTGRQEFTEHAAMYRRDADRCRGGTAMLRNAGAFPVAGHRISHSPWRWRGLRYRGRVRWEVCGDGFPAGGVCRVRRGRAGAARQVCSGDGRGPLDPSGRRGRARGGSVRRGDPGGR